jgi:hypothetical protein
MGKVPPKTGVLTFHRCINYGTYWQARCLLDCLRSKGCRALLIDHHSLRANWAEWRCALHPLLPSRGLRRDVFFYGSKLLKFFRATASLPRSGAFPLEKPQDMEPFDLVIVGSDEVWNLKHPWYGGCRLFFGEDVRAPRVVSYAASFGNYDAGQGLDREWARCLRRFEAISVRDENSRRLVSQATGREPPVVLDPCLLQPPEAAGPAAEDPYVAVYGHSFSKLFLRNVRRWAKARRWPLVSIGYRNAWADRQWIAASPDDFLHFMARAGAVATNFFHGCVFALRFGKPFVAEKSAYRCQKIEGLLGLLREKDRLMWGEAPPARYRHGLEAPVKGETRQAIARLRRVSWHYLDRILEGAA